MPKGTLRKCKNGHSYYKSSDCPVCPKCEVERKPQDEFLSLFAAPARRALERKNISSLNQLTNYTENEIVQWHAMGPRSMTLIKNLLKAKKMRLKKT